MFSNIIDVYKRIFVDVVLGSLFEIVKLGPELLVVLVMTHHGPDEKHDHD